MNAPTTETATPTETAAPDVCPRCGSHVLFTVELEYAGLNGFRPDVNGTVPEVGDTITSCGECAAFVVHGAEAPASTSTAPPSSIEPAPPASSMEELMGRLYELEGTLGAKIDTLSNELENEKAAHTVTKAQLAQSTSVAVSADATTTPAVEPPTPTSDAATAPPVAPVPDPPVTAPDAVAATPATPAPTDHPSKEA